MSSSSNNNNSSSSSSSNNSNNNNNNSSSNDSNNNNSSSNNTRDFKNNKSSKNIYISKNRCKFYLKIHLILVCKYRKRLLEVKRIDDDMKQIIYDISNISSFNIDVMETDKDHIHILLNIIPTYSISAIVNRIKSISSNRIWKLHWNFLRHHFWKERTFWSDGYFVCSIGEANPDTIRKYIEDQG
jgi:putative transposase